MEAASVAWEPLGWKPVAFSEIEPFPCAILKHRFPNTPNHGDLTQYQQWPISTGDVDLIAGGPPCQAFSVAGLRRGLADPRGNLTLTYLGLVDKLQPRWVVYENVPGLLSVDGGSAFGSFLGGLAELGYSAAWRVLDAQYVGSCRLHPHERGQSAVPQRRRRVFVVAVRGAGNWQLAAEVLSIAEGMRGNTPSRRKKGQGSAAGAEGSAGADHPEGCWWDGGQVSQTLDAVLQKGQTMPEKNRFPAVLQPKPVVIDRAAFNQGQNAQYEPHIEESEVMDSLVARGPHAVGVPLPIAFKVRGGGNYSGTKGGEVKPDEKGGTGYLGYEDKTFTVATTQDQWVAAPVPFRKSKRACSTTDNETWVEADASNTLNNFDLGDTRTTHAIVEPHIVQASELRLRGQITEKDICPTLTAGAKQGDTDPLAVHPVAFQPGNLRRQGGADPSSEIFPTLTKDSGDQSPHVANHPPMAVRRLTPVECERLQGFPDNWSRISWKGKPEDQCPDGPRYKACGNSMAVPVMRWIGQRIAEVDAKYPCNKASA